MEKKKASGLIWRQKNRAAIRALAKLNRERRLENPEYRERERLSCRTWQLANINKVWLASIKSRAKKLGIPFDEDTSDIVVPEFCPILGIVLQRGAVYGGWNSPSLDKIVPTLGYVKDNRWVISKRANTIKSNATYDELILIGKWAQQMKDKENA